MCVGVSSIHPGDWYHAGETSGTMLVIPVPAVVLAVVTLVMPGLPLRVAAGKSLPAVCMG